jgi:hypothetical protein
MCFGGGKSHQPQPQQAPPPNPATEFNPNANRDTYAQKQADRAAAISQSDMQVSSTGQSFGAELGADGAIGGPSVTP